MENIEGKTYEVEIIPKKRVLRSIARDLNLTMAVMELIDNSIDAWKRNNTGNKLVVNIKINKADDAPSIFEYADNSGGVKINNISQLFTLGDTGASEEEESIGEFGVGLKRALFSMAQAFSIESKFQGEKGFVCNVKVDSFLSDSNWKLNYTVGTSIPDGKSSIKFVNLNYEVSEKIEREIRKAIAETYSRTIANNGEVFVNNTEIIFHKFGRKIQVRFCESLKSFYYLSDYRMVKI